MTSETDVTAKIEQLNESVREIARAALELEQTQMLRALQHLGHMAGEAMELRLIMQPLAPATGEGILDSVIAQTPLETVLLIPEQQPAPIEEDPVEPFVSAAIDEPVVELASEPEPEKHMETTAEPEDQPVAVTERNHSEGEVKWTARELKMLEFMKSNPGRWIAPREVRQALTDDRSTECALKQAVTKFFKQLEESPYGVHLQHRGKKSSSMYYFDPGGNQISEPSVDTLRPEEDQPVLAPAVSENITSPKPETTAHRDETEKIELTNWRLTVSQNGHRRITVGDTPLNVKGVAADILLEITKHKDGVEFTKLLAILRETNRHAGPNNLDGILGFIEKDIKRTGVHDPMIRELSQGDEEPQSIIRFRGTYDHEGLPDFLADR